MSNTLITISDNKIGVDIGTDNTADYYQATVLSATDYYAFGMSMKERSWQSESYRYGFNGKENDADWDVQDYGFRIYKPEISKFLSVDPLTQSYPWYTPYQFAGNSPILNIDLDGLEKKNTQENKRDDGGNISNLSLQQQWEQANPIVKFLILFNVWAEDAGRRDNIISGRDASNSAGNMINGYNKIMEPILVVQSYADLVRSVSPIRSSRSPKEPPYPATVSPLVDDIVDDIVKSSQYNNFTLIPYAQRTGTPIVYAQHVSGLGEKSWAQIIYHNGEMILEFGLFLKSMVKGQMMKFGRGYNGKDPLFQQLYNKITNNGALKVDAIRSNLQMDNLDELNSVLKGMNIKGIPTKEQYQQAIKQTRIGQNAASYGFDEVRIPSTPDYDPSNKQVERISIEFRRKRN